VSADCPGSDAPAGFARLIEIIAELRGDHGCPWDKEQTPETLKRFVLEEAYEVCEAIDSGCPEALCEELGDLLLQIVLQSQIAREFDRFEIAAVVRGICEKLIRRHPWVFADVEVNSASDALNHWEEIKQTEKAETAGSAAETLYDRLPAALPALMKAHQVQSKASHVGFDWERPEPALEKVAEELGEVQTALTGPPERLTEELGDLLFAVVNVARLAGVDAEQALTAATRKFAQRFARIDKAARQQGTSLEALSLAQMDALWDAEKATEAAAHAT